MVEQINITGIPVPFMVTYTPPDSKQYYATVSGLTVMFSAVIAPPVPNKNKLAY
jgi:hypothetical protein